MSKKDGEISQGRVWYRTTEDGILIGLTSRGIETAGSPERLELPVEGDEFSHLDSIAAVEGSLARVEIPAPFDCVILEVNTSLEGELETLEDDPLEAGWVARVERLERDEEDDEDEDDADEDGDEEEDPDDDSDEDE